MTIESQLEKVSADLSAAESLASEAQAKVADLEAKLGEATAFIAGIVPERDRLGDELAALQEKTKDFDASVQREAARIVAESGTAAPAPVAEPAAASLNKDAELLAKYDSMPNGPERWDYAVTHFNALARARAAQK